MNKFKVGDKVSNHINGVKYEGVVVETNSGLGTSYLCQFEGFCGHHGNKMTNRGYDYEENNYWYCDETELTLIKETKRVKRKDTNMGRSLKIADYKVENNKVVIVTFTDGSTQKAVCAPEDTFDFDRAIEICVMKQVCGGTSEYNTFISKALKDIKRIDKDRIKTAKEAEERKKIEDNHYAKMQKRKEKRRQKRIDEMAEAYKKAWNDTMKTMGTFN